MKHIRYFMVAVVCLVLFGSVHAGWDDVVHLRHIKNETTDYRIKFINNEIGFSTVIEPGAKVEVDVNSAWFPWYWGGGEDRKFVFIIFEKVNAAAPDQTKIRMSDDGSAGMRISDENDQLLEKIFHLYRGSIYSLVIKPVKMGPPHARVYFELEEKGFFHRLFGGAEEIAREVVKDIVGVGEKAATKTVKTIAKAIKGGVDPQGEEGETEEDGDADEDETEEEAIANEESSEEETPKQKKKVQKIKKKVKTPKKVKKPKKIKKTKKTKKKKKNK